MHSSFPSVVLGIHRGAIDQSTVTTQSPSDVMRRVRDALKTMGIITEVESEYKLRCTRPKRDSHCDVIASVKDDASVVKAVEPGIPAHELWIKNDVPREISRSIDGGSGEEVATPKANPRELDMNQEKQLELHTLPCLDIAYGSQEPGDEVRFSVELTQLEGLSGTYSLDIRRLKGNLRSYKFVYDTLREHIDFRG